MEGKQYHRLKKLYMCSWTVKKVGDKLFIDGWRNTYEQSSTYQFTIQLIQFEYNPVESYYFMDKTFWLFSFLKSKGIVFSSSTHRFSPAFIDQPTFWPWSHPSVTTREYTSKSITLYPFIIQFQLRNPSRMLSYFIWSPTWIIHPPPSLTALLPSPSRQRISFQGPLFPVSTRANLSSLTLAPDFEF